MTPEESAVVTYLLRTLGCSHPEGKTDNGGRWYPSDTERAECCSHIRSPSRRYPWSLYKHCHSLAHIASQYGADIKMLRSMLKNKPLLMGLHPRIDEHLEKEFKGEIAQ